MKPVSICLIVSGLVVSTAIMGCDSENEKKYDATVGWNISGQQTCRAILVAPGEEDPETVTLDKVVVTLYENKNYKTAPVLEDVRVTQSEGDCTDFQLDLQDLERGTYWATVEAFAQRESDSKAYPYYFGEGELKVPAADGSSTNLTLTVGKGDILVQWYFEPKEKCPADGTMKIAIDAGSNINDYNSKEEISCDLEGGFLVVGKSWDSYQLTLEAWDANNQLSHRGTCVDDDGNEIEEFELHPGETYECWVELFAI